MATPKYWIAQHIPDLFRKEPSNVGVFLQVGDHILTRFMGEKEDGTLDGRRLRRLPHPKVFAQWVEFWRDTCAEDREVVPSALGGHHYRVIEGGTLSGQDVGAHAHMLEYLFNMLVSPEGAVAALMMDSEREEQALRKSLDDEIASVFHEQGIMDGDQPLYVRHPIQQREIIRGDAVEHTPSFSQRNGKLYVIEHVDFTHRMRQRMSDLAGRAAYMFTDLRRAHPDMESITLVRIDDEARDDEHVSYGLGMLKGESSRVIDWLDPDARRDFIEERVVIAKST